MRPLPATPVDSPAAWRPEDFKDDNSWIIRFDPEMLDELDSAVATCKQRGIGAFEATKDDFVVPRVATCLRGIERELDSGRGFVLLRGLPVEKYTADDLRLLYWGLGIHLGTPISQNGLGELISEVTDRGYDRSVENVRGYTTRGGQNPHTDHGDVVGLLCVHPAKSGGKSAIASSISVFNEIVRTRPDYLHYLGTGLHWDLRGEGPTRDLDEVTNNELPMFSYFDGALSVKFNAKTSVAGMKKAGMPLSEEALAAIAYVSDLARSDAFRLDMDFQPGDIQLLCNHSIMHARTGYEDWLEENRRRRLYRLWVNLPNGRKLAPEFADRTNMGYMAGFYATDDAQYWAGSSKDQIEAREI